MARHLAVGAPLWPARPMRMPVAILCLLPRDCWTFVDWDGEGGVLRLFFLFFSLFSFFPSFFLPLVSLFILLLACQCPALLTAWRLLYKHVRISVCNLREISKQERGHPPVFWCFCLACWSIGALLTRRRMMTGRGDECFSNPLDSSFSPLVLVLVLFLLIGHR